MKKHKRLLSIAGFDGSGGAGIQADIKTFSALGCYGMSVLTSLPIQNTKGVQNCYSLPISSISEQIVSIIEDIGVDIIKIGMLENAEIIEVVANTLKPHLPIKIVCDPVMVAKNGERLIKTEAIIALKELIFPISYVITPNIPEAEELLAIKISNYSDMYQAAIELSRFKAKAVLLKGGHLVNTTQVKDLLMWDNKSLWLEEERIITKNTHGTGCTLSAAIAAFLAYNLTLEEAVWQAKKYITQAIFYGSKYKVGHGYGPVHHFFNFWD